MKRQEVPKGAELDFGVRWRLLEEPHGWDWRVSWNPETGELYAQEMRGFERGRRITLGHYPDREAVEAALAGWASEPVVIAGKIANSIYVHRQAG